MPGYLAPEVATGDVARAASDVFSLGASLSAAVEGVPPWGRDDLLAVLRRATKGTVPPATRAGGLAPGARDPELPRRPLVPGYTPRPLPQPDAETHQPRSGRCRSPSSSPSSSSASGTCSTNRTRSR